jgi:hypothetical protein
MFFIHPPKKAASVYLDESYSELDLEFTKQCMDQIIAQRKGYRDYFTVFEDATLLKAIDKRHNTF